MSKNHETPAAQAPGPLEPTDPLRKLGLRPATIRALAEAGIRTICDLTSKTFRQIYYTPKIGPARAIETFKASRNHGLVFRTEDAPRASLAMRLEARRTSAKDVRCAITAMRPTTDPSVERSQDSDVAPGSNGTV
jgi:hypothetical protein